MTTVDARKMKVKPLIETTQHEYWCEDCTFGRRSQAFPSNSNEALEAGKAAEQSALDHMDAFPDHVAHTRMDQRNIDTTPARRPPAGSGVEPAGKDTARFDAERARDLCARFGDDWTREELVEAARLLRAAVVELEILERQLKGVEHD